MIKSNSRKKETLHSVKVFWVFAIFTAIVALFSISWGVENEYSALITVGFLFAAFMLSIIMLILGMSRLSTLDKPHSTHKETSKPPKRKMTPKEKNNTRIEATNKRDREYRRNRRDRRNRDRGRRQ